MNFGLNGKVAIVAASSQGLGKASAFALASEGANVVICSRDKKNINKTAGEISEKTGAAIHPVVCDVTKPREIQKLVKEAMKKFGKIHILVNNAGGPPTGDFLKLTDTDWEKAFILNMMSTVRLTREVLPSMLKQKWGRVITIVSIAAKQPITDLILSSSIRPGILGLTRVLSTKYASSNITFNTVCPGFILTNRQDELMKMRAAATKTPLEEYLANNAKDIPTGRMGKPEEVGNTIAFLASEQASYINGANLLVDGGMAKGIF